MQPIHADITRASTPEPAFYTDPALLLAEETAVFARSWQFVGHASQLARPGDYFTTTLGREPLVFVNDDGVLRGFFNVCRHRAGAVAVGCGHTRRLVCRYHGWAYDLSGRLRTAPEMEGAQDFDKADIKLAPVAVHQFGPLLFAALDPTTPSFDDFYPDLSARCAPLGLERMQHFMTRDFHVASNWKIYVENFLEGYHIPAVHPALNRELDYRAYVTELGKRHVLQYAPVQAGTASLYRDGAGDGSAYYFWLHPNVMLNIYEGLLQTNVVIPDGVDRCTVRFDWFAIDPKPDQAKDAHFLKLLEFSVLVQEEDRVICETVQKNLGSRAARPGRYSPLRETGPHLFHRLITEGSDPS